MERRSFVRHAGLAGVLAAGAAPAVVHAQANIRWRLASSFPKSLDTIYGAADEFSKKVAAASTMALFSADRLLKAFWLTNRSICGPPSHQAG